MTNASEQGKMQMDRCCIGCVSWPISVPILMTLCFLYYSGYLIYWAILATVGNSEPEKNEAAVILGTVMACLTALELPLIISTFYVVSTKYYICYMLTIYHSIVSIGIGTFFVYSFLTAVWYINSATSGVVLITYLALFFTYFLPGFVSYLICNHLISRTIAAKLSDLAIQEMKNSGPSNTDVSAKVSAFSNSQPLMNSMNGYKQEPEPTIAKV
eukprot:Awhi_evm2s15184